MGSGPVPTLPDRVILFFITLRYADSVLTSLFRVDLGSEPLDFVSYGYGRVTGPVQVQGLMALN